MQLRKDWGGSGNLDLKFLGFFEFQAVLNAFLTLPLLIACFNPAPQLSRARARGPGAVPRRASSARALADAQLAAFKRKPANQGGVCDVGLWHYSRHPELLLRVAHLDCLRGVRAGLAARLDRAGDAGADAALPDQRDGPEGHRGASAAHEGRALPALPGPHQRFRSVVSAKRGPER